MVDVIASSDFTAVIGMGQTGLSVAKFLTRKQQRFMMLDTRNSPPNKEAFEKMFPGVACEFGPLNSETLCAANQIIVSPGVDIKEPAIQSAIQNGVSVKSDIQLFVDSVVAPVVAITGSNGKSTVTTLVGDMFRHAGKKVAVAGNIGIPVLDLLTKEQEFEHCILEVSSFQLETTSKLNADVAVILNITADHMDRYASLQDYHRAKQRVFFGAKHVVVNRDDPLTQPPARKDLPMVSFGLGKPDLNQFGLITDANGSYLALGLQKLLNINLLKIRGKHNIANALAALAIGKLSGLSMEAMLDALVNFSGLPHRCQWVRELNGVTYINDSKGTNVGATVAAIEGLAEQNHKIVLIAGGEGKGADFTALTAIFRQHVRALVAIGKDAGELIEIAKQANIEAKLCKTLKQAVIEARSSALVGDIVLLSPACASFDMFNDYVDRGEHFVKAVGALAA